MSFSSDIKKEICKISSFTNKELVKFEILGYLMTSNILVKNNKIKFSTENEYNINRFGKLLNNIGILDYDIKIQGKTYTVTIPKIKEKEFILRWIHLDKTIKEIKIDKIKDELNEPENEEERNIRAKALLRGNFLGSGSVNDPNKTYHLEIIYPFEKYTIFIQEIMQNYEVEFHLLERGKDTSIYLKEGEEISNLLAFIGANTSVLKFEEIRVIRNMRNNVNRLVNCETANLNKIVQASVKQVNDIEYIKKKNKFSDLTENQQEIANLRCKHPDSSLEELGKMLNPSIGKSGVNHRLKAISKIAEELRESK